MSSSISEPFIERPVATSLLMVAVILLGLLGYNFLSISALPAVDFPTIQVTTLYPGGSPEVMASLVTTPLEHQLGQISGLTSMISDSSLGTSTITLQFGLDRNIDNAAQDVQAAINSAKGTLPSNLPYPPVYSKVNPADAAIVSLAVTSESIPIDRVNDVADTILGQKLSQVTGVGLVTIEGNQKPAVRIQANPAALAANGIGLEDVRNAVAQANVNAPKGSFNGTYQSYTIGANDQIGTAAEFKPVIITYQNGAPVRLADVAKVTDGVENDQLAAWVGGKPAVLLDVQRQPGANIIETVDRIRAVLPSLEAAIPKSIKVDILSDRTSTIRASVRDVEMTLLLTVALVVMVIFVFLRKLWATVIPSVALPLSLIGTFGVMALCGFSLDNLSLMALTIATGFVVDDAIVMIENIVRYIELGDDPETAARNGARQIGFTVVSLTISLIAVFIPLLLMPGVIGRLFREFSLVLSIAVILSALISLTLTPMMCARLLKREDGEGGAHGGGPRWMAWTERGFDALLAGYERTLRVVMRAKFLTLMIALATLALTIFMYIVIPKGLIPSQDTGLITGVTEASQSTSFAAMVERQKALTAVVSRDKDVESVSGFVGAGTINPTLSSGRLTIVLKPLEARSSSVTQIIERIKGEAAGVQGISLFMQPVQDLQIDARVSRTEYQYVLQDSRGEELAVWAPKLIAAMQAQPSITDVASNQQSDGLQLKLTIDRNQASRLGVPVQSIDDTLYDAFGQRQISTIYTETNQYRVILEVPPSFRDQPDALNKIYIRTNSAGTTTTSSNATSANAEGVTASTGSGAVTTSSTNMVPLSAVASMQTVPAALVVSHQGQLPAVTVSFNLAPGHSLSDAVADIAAAQASIGMPNSVQTGFSGTAAEFKSSLTSMPLLILAAIVVIYIVLGVLYESYIHPITILSTLPSAGVGALLALMLTGQELSIVALIGIILLIGIVKKNAIMMIDFALEAERDQGMSPEESILRAASLRFRPIMMTTMAALLGALPLALEHGTGSELRRPLGISIVGGLLLSQLLTLYTTPVIYLYMDRFASLFSRPKKLATGAPPVPAS